MVKLLNGLLSLCSASDRLGHELSLKFGGSGSEISSSELIVALIDESDPNDTDGTFSDVSIFSAIEHTGVFKADVCANTESLS